MIILPIVERELRVASRRPATYWLRFLLALGVWVLWFLLMTYGPSAVPATRGQMVFMSLGTLTFAFCLLAGVILTADSLSQEKREGTIGLLFLTELKGYDVVLGKLIATSIHAFYGLGAVLPLLAYSMLVGGVTLGESCRLGLALLAGLFFSLSVGMFVSAHSRDARQAMGRTLLALVAGAILLPVLGLALLQVSRSAFWTFLCWPSPICSFISAFDARFQGPGGALRFCASLLTVLGLSATILLLAGRQLARAWQEKGETEESKVGRAVLSAPPPVATAAASEQTPGSRRAEDCPPYLSDSKTSAPSPAFAARADALEANPYYWLAGRDPRPRQKARVFLGSFFPIWLCFLLGCFSGSGATRTFCFFGAILMTYGLHQALKWLMAFEASRRLSEDRHSGALELLLVTPISIEEIIAGQKRAFRDLFNTPIWLGVLANLVLFVLTIFVNPASLASQEIVILSELYLGGILLLVVDSHVLGWVGMWMALRTRRQVRAMLATWGRVMLAPCAAIFVLVLLTIGGGGLSAGTALALSPLWFGLAAVIEHAFASRAELGLVEAFRQISSAPDLPAPSPMLLVQPAPATTGEA